MHEQRPPSRGYTVIELLVTIAIITLLAALVFVAVGFGLRAGRDAAERRNLAALAVAIEDFRREFGFYPPLVSGNPFPDNDPNSAANGGPPAAGPIIFDTQLNRLRPLIIGETQGGYPSRADAADAFLRGDFALGLPRWSAYSLSIYLVGSLGKDITGVDGPGSTAPDRTLTYAFKPGGRSYLPRYDLGGIQRRLRLPDVPTADPRVPVLYDRWDQPIRYYRWEPRYGPDGTVESYNVPAFLGDPRADDNPRLRTARFALVSAGRDQRIDENDPRAQVNQDNIVILGGEP